MIRMLVRLYPAVWQARYGEEFTAMMEQKKASLLDVLNILLGAADAHLHQDMILRQLMSMERMKQIMNRVLGLFSKGLATFVVFGIAVCLFTAMLDDSPFVPAMRNTQAFDLTTILSMAGLLVVLLAVFVGGIPALRAVFKSAGAETRRELRKLALIPVFVLAAMAAAFCILNIGYGNVVPGWIRGSVNDCMLAGFVTVCGLSVHAMLKKGGEQAAGAYKPGIYAAPVAAAGMVAAAVGIVVWGMTADAYLPGVMMDSKLGIFQSSTIVFYVVLAVLIAACAAVAGVTAVRGMRLAKQAA